MGKIVIVIVNWNGGDRIMKCLESLNRSLNALNGVVIVVDNGSGDGSPERIQETEPRVKLVRNRENLGFSRANNQGLKFIFDHRIPTDYVLFLNNDTEMVNDSLEEMVGFMDNHPDIVALTPCIREREGQFQTGVGGRRFTLVNMIVYHFFLNRLPFLRGRGINLNQKYYCQKKKTVDLDWISGAAMMVRWDCIDGFPLFPERYFMYAEDLVVSDLLKKKGRLVLYPFATIRHHRGYGPRNLDRYYDSLFTYLKEKGFSRLQLTASRAIIFLGLVFRVVLFRIWALFNRDKMDRVAINGLQIQSLKRIHFQTPRPADQKKTDRYG